MSVSVRGKSRFLSLVGFLLMLALPALACDLPNPVWVLKQLMPSVKVSIARPAHNQTFVEGEPVHLDGVYETDEDCEEAYWESNLDGMLTPSSQQRDCDMGSFIVISNLSPGTHTLEYHVEDENGSNSETVTIRILAAESQEYSRLKEIGKFTLSVSSDQPDITSDVVAAATGAIIEGSCPPTDAEHAWAVEGKDKCNWQVDYDISPFEISLVVDPDQETVRVILDGDLTLQILFEDGMEDGSGTISANEYLDHVSVTSSIGDDFVMEGILPVRIFAEGYYEKLRTSDGYIVTQAGGYQITLPVDLTLDTEKKRLELRFSEEMTKLPTNFGDGTDIIAISFDICVIWTDKAETR